MENYDTGNYGEEQDFEGQQQAIARALRRAQSLASSAYAGVTRPRANPLHYVANYLSQRNADAELSAAEKKAAEFGAAKERKVTDLVTQISTPGTKRVLKQTLGGSDAPLGGQNVAPQTETQEPLDPVAENQRQMGLAMTLGRIDPKLASPFIASGAAFPEKMATLKATQEARAEENRRRAEDRMTELEARLQDKNLDRASREQMAAESRSLRAGLAGLGGSNADLQRELLQARIDKLHQPAPETPSQAKARMAREKSDEGLAGLNDTTVEIQDTLDKLDKAGGMTSTKKGALPNAMTSLGASAIGQMAGRVVGSEVQSHRDVLGSLKKQLLLDIKQATGMGAGQLNSNVELQTWLSSLGSDGMTREANQKILDNIRSKYLGRSSAPAAPAAPGELSDEELLNHFLKK